MSDLEIIRFCGLGSDPPEVQRRFLAALTSRQRELLDAMLMVELWDKSGGILPLPPGVFVD